MCIADTSTARVAPKQRAARHEQAPAPAFAVVAPAKRFDATEQDARCVRARDASPTRERHPDERDARESSRRDARTHHVRSTPPTATRASSSRGRAVRVPGARVGRRFGFFRGREQPIATATRAGNGARAGRRGETHVDDQRQELVDLSLEGERLGFLRHGRRWGVERVSRSCAAEKWRRRATGGK